jgi:hypothetical protein
MPIQPGPVGGTYSFKDLVGVINNPLLGAPYQLVGGNIGNGSITIRMLTTRTEHEVAADGTVMPTYVSGSNAEVTIEVQQTSALHHFLLMLYNLLTTAADSSDVSNWVSTVISLRTILDGSGHTLQGVSFQKIPDKPYAAKGQNVTWVLMSAYCVNQ